MRRELRVITREDDPLTVSIIAPLCLLLGFRHGAKIITCFGEEATVMGVAVIPKGCRHEGQRALWYKKDDGFTYYYEPGDLREKDFRLAK